jgi:hypothetical protein
MSCNYKLIRRSILYRFATNVLPAFEKRLPHERSLQRPAFPARS